MYDDRFAKGRGRRTRNVSFMRDHWVYFGDDAPLGDKSQTDWLLDSDAFLLEQSGLLDGIEYGYNSDGEFEWLGLSECNRDAIVTDWEYSMSSPPTRLEARETWAEWYSKHNQEAVAIRRKKEAEERMREAEAERKREEQQRLWDLEDAIEQKRIDKLRAEEAARKAEEARQQALKDAEEARKKAEVQKNFEALKRRSPLEQLRSFLKRDPTEWELGFFTLVLRFDQLCLTFSVAAATDDAQRQEHLVIFDGERYMFFKEDEFLTFLFRGVSCELQALPPGPALLASYRSGTNSGARYIRAAFNTKMSINLLREDLIAIQKDRTVQDANKILWILATLKPGYPSKTVTAQRRLTVDGKSWLVNFTFSRSNNKTTELPEYKDVYGLLS